MKLSAPLLVALILVSAHCGQAILRREKSFITLDAESMIRYDPKKGHYCRRLVDTLDTLKTIPSNSDRYPEDPIFAPNSYSIYNSFHKVRDSNKDKKSGLKTFYWEDMHTFADEINGGDHSFSIFGDGNPRDDIFTTFATPEVINSNDIVQGELGDCYFLAAIAAIAQRDGSLIKNAFTDPKDYELTHEVNFNANGRKVPVLVDDLIPIHIDLNGDRDLVFHSIANAKNFWPIIMEKAWAKMHSSYNGITGGTDVEVMHSLLQVPVEYVEPTSMPAKDLYAKIKEALDVKDYFVTTNTNTHAYAVMEVQDKTFNVRENDGSVSQLKIEAVRVRNPHGKDKTWSGDTFEKTYTGLQGHFPNPHKGSFWIEINDFVAFFTHHVGFGYYNKDYTTTTKKDDYKKENNNRWVVYEFELPNPVDADGAWFMTTGVEERLMPTGCRRKNGQKTITYGAAYKMDNAGIDSMKVLENPVSQILHYDHVHLKAHGKYKAAVQVKYPNDHYSETNAAVYYKKGENVKLKGPFTIDTFAADIVKYIVDEYIKDHGAVTNSAADSFNGPNIPFDRKETKTPHRLASYSRWVEFSPREDLPTQYCMVVYGVDDARNIKKLDFKIEFPGTEKLVSTGGCNEAGGNTECSGLLNKGEYWGACFVEGHTTIKPGSKFDFTKKNRV